MTDDPRRPDPDLNNLRKAGTGELRDMVPDPDALKRKAAADGPSPLRQPPGLFLLFVVEMWERFSYYGMRALLVLYLITLTPPLLQVATSAGTVGILGAAEGAGPLASASAVAASASKAEAIAHNPGRGWTESQAYLLYGWYTGLAYLLPLLGGYLADRFLGTHRSMLMGGTLIALGHIVLAVSGLGHLDASAAGMSTFIGGLALIIIGTGFFKPCVSVMVGQLYSPNDPRRDGGFTIFYMGINLGAFICAFVCGTLGEKVGWHWGFGAAAVGMVAGMIVYLIGRQKYLAGIGEPPAGAPNVIPLLFPASLLVAAAVAASYHLGGFGRLVAGVSALMSHPTVQVAVPVALVAVVLGLVAWFVAIQQPGDRGPTATIFLFMLFNAFFWLAFEQAGSTLNVFAKQDVDRNLFGFEVPASWFQSVNPLVILLVAPLFAALWDRLGRRGLNPPQSVKISLGLLLLGAGYAFIVFGARQNALTGLPVSMIWLIATYFFHTLGELCLSPTGLSFVTKTAPVRFVSLLMGCWFVSNFLANLGAGLVGTYVKQIETGKIELFWYPWFRLGGRADFFFLFVLSSVAGGLLILILTPLTRRLLHGRG